MPAGLDSYDNFGISIAGIGDVNGDGVEDLAVGAIRDEHLATREGAVYLLLLNSNRTVASHIIISDGLAEFVPSNLNGGDRPGSSVANFGDLDHDGAIDLAVGAHNDEHLQGAEGAVYIARMSLGIDFADAPDTGAGTGQANYETFVVVFAKIDRSVRFDDDMAWCYLMRSRSRRVEGDEAGATEDRSRALAISPTIESSLE